jgi:hypothetical protein
MILYEVLMHDELINLLKFFKWHGSIARESLIDRDIVPCVHACDACSKLFTAKLLWALGCGSL